jgi:hypothetical protein
MIPKNLYGFPRRVPRVEWNGRDAYVILVRSGMGGHRRIVDIPIPHRMKVRVIEDKTRVLWGWRPVDASCYAMDEM